MKTKKPQIHRMRHRSLKAIRLWLGFALACTLAVITGTTELIWRFELSFAIVLAFPVGHLMLGFALALNRLSFKYAWGGLRGSLKLLYRPFGGETMLFYFILAISEELIFRAVPLSVLGGAWWHVLMFAAAFSAIHLFNKIRGPALLLALDFFLFGVILGFVFTWLGEFWPLVIIHWIRNAGLAKIYDYRAPKRDNPTGQKPMYPIETKKQVS
jgi:membrane protease YdiL (CAAX protease family)